MPTTLAPATTTLLDEVLPRYEFRGVVARTIQAPPATIFRALREVTMQDMPLATFLGNLRYLPGRLTGRTPPTQTVRPFWDEAQLQPLLETPDQEVVTGTIGRLHDLLDQQFVPLPDLAPFQHFQHPDYQKLAISLRLEPGPTAGTYRFVMEHRTLPLGSSARWKFTIYWWLLVRWASGLMGGLLLDAVKRRAEGTTASAV